MYFKMVAGKYVPCGVPAAYVTAGGDTIVGFNHLPDEELASHGFFRGRYETPEHDPRVSRVSGEECVCNGTEVVVRCAVEPIPLAELVRDRIAEAYDVCRTKLDAQAAGYSAAEIAEWPALRAEVRQYAANKETGAYMQAAISRGRHTPETLFGLLWPKVQAYDAALAQREGHVLALMAMTDPLEVATYQIIAAPPV